MNESVLRDHAWRDTSPIVGPRLEMRILKRCFTNINDIIIIHL